MKPQIIKDIEKQTSIELQQVLFKLQIIDLAPLSDN